MARFALTVATFILSTATTWLVLFTVFVGKMDLLGDYVAWTFTGGGPLVSALAYASLFAGAGITFSVARVLRR